MTSSRLLLVTNHMEERPKGGRELLCKLNHDLLRVLLGDALEVFVLPSRSGGTMRSALRGHIDGVNDASIGKVVALVRGRPDLRTVFIDGSNLGMIARGLKRALPGVEVISFFHNVETRFFLGSLKARRTMHAAGVLLANFLAERAAVRWSDKRVCLSERDSRLLRKMYGQGATHVAPMALEDKLSAAKAPVVGAPAEPFALFVGGTFYANRVGIEWYVDHVAPRSDVQVRIVGRGFDALRTRLETCANVRVIGEVGDLSDWYRDARFVIAPIFDGSGMKTKVAEALMYGKKVVGTREAFSGYEDVLPEAGWVCQSADAFVSAVAQARDAALPALDPQLRQLFVDRYSQHAALARMRALVGRPDMTTSQQAAAGTA